MRKKILSVFLVIFMVMAFFPIKSQAAADISRLRVGGVEVTEANKNDILGDGTCSFDPNLNELTLNNANITCNNECIYATSSSTDHGNNPSLKIILKGKNYLKSTGDAGIRSSNVNLTIDGSQGGTLETIGNKDGIYTPYSTLDIQNVGYLKAEGGSYPGIYVTPKFESSAPYALKIKDSIVYAHSNSDQGIYTPGKPLIISGGSVAAASTNSTSDEAFFFPDGITLEDGLTISEPEGGTIGPTTIKNPDGTTAKRAVIGNGHLITAAANPSAGGSVTGDGAYANNTTTTLKATPAEGYRFINWTENEEEVSTAPTYSFTVTKGRDLVANFERVYTIKFVNDDGTELQSSSVAYGETPVYSGETPTKPATEEYTYTFAGWSPEITSVTEDATYTATYTQAPREYNIKFTNDNDTELQSSSVAYGETPIYNGETPTKEATAQYTYEFLAWSPAIVPVSADAVYKATYSNTVNEYTIRFVNEDGTELQSSSVVYGETPVYNGETPTKPDDDQYTYTFAGWNPEIAEVTGDATYTAVYSAEDKTEHSKSESDDEDVSEVTSDDEETPKSDVSKTETKEQETYDAPNTGDEANVLPLIALLIMSLLCLIYIFLNKRKYKYYK